MTQLMSSIWLLTTYDINFVFDKRPLCVVARAKSSQKVAKTEQKSTLLELFG